MFHFSKVFIPILSLVTKVLKLQWGSKNKVINPFYFGVEEMCLDERILNLVSELKWITCDLIFGRKTVEN